MTRIALVTGAGRGIGLEMCRQLTEAGDEVLACPRIAGSAALDALAVERPRRLHVVPMDEAAGWLRKKTTKRRCIDPKVYTALLFAIAAVTGDL